MWQQSEKQSFWNKVLFNIPLKYWVTVIAVPIGINLLVWIPNKLAYGGGDEWMGFFGNYAGGIVGAFVAYLIAKSQTDVAIKQMQDEKARYEGEKKEAAEEQKRRDEAFRNAMFIFLYDEIKSNIEKIHISTLAALRDRGNSKPLDSNYLLGFRQHPFATTIFDQMKFDIPKYKDSSIIEAIFPYKVFQLLEKYDSVNVIPQHSASAAYQIINEWNNKLQNQHYFF